MKDFHLLMGTLGVGLGVAILLLVRRDHLYIRHGVFWMAVALGSVVLGIWPRLVDRIGEVTGVAYPPALLFLLAIMMLIIRAVIADIAFTRLRREVRLLNPKITLMEPEVRIQMTGVTSAFDQERKADVEAPVAKRLMDAKRTASK